MKDRGKIFGSLPFSSSEYYKIMAARRPFGSVQVFNGKTFRDFGIIFMRIDHDKI